MFNKYEKQIELLKKQYSKAEKNLVATIKQSENKSPKSIEERRSSY